MKTKILCSAVVASLAASVGAAAAADLAVKAPVYKAPPPPPPVILSDWAGFYIGAHGGGAWGDNKFDFGSFGNTKTSGGLGGGHVGYNWQFGQFVVGVEGDFDGADISATDAFGVRQKTDELATARGRVGYAFAPNLLAFGTGGYAYGHTKLSGFGGNDQNGWAAGGGLEYKVWGPVSVRGEYLHYDFDGTAVPFDNLKSTIDVVRGGVSYKF